MKNAASKAVRIVSDIRTEYNAMDCKILNKVARLIIKYGAISAERLMKITKFQFHTIGWALWHLDAIETGSGLWVLPE